jgi:ectoine hydroxylase-related dioxygenase (phytanoyl-CoA dioxygenase family)
MSGITSYGIVNQVHADSELDEQLEELRINGYTIIPKVLSDAELQTARTKLDEVYEMQVKETGLPALESIAEENMARCPLAYDDFFISLVTRTPVLDLVGAAIDNKEILLHLQNGIINRPNAKHHQSSWHRDLPYQEYVSSKPLALGALFCIDEFSVETGCTYVLPHSHRVEQMPSTKYVSRHQKPAEAPPGSVIVFDAMLYHRAGYNSSNRIRRGINHVYAVPLLKQQIDIPAMLKGRHAEDPLLNKLLGYRTSVAHSVKEYREMRQTRKK